LSQTQDGSYFTIGRGSQQSQTPKTSFISREGRALQVKVRMDQQVNEFGSISLKGAEQKLRHFQPRLQWAFGEGDVAVGQGQGII